jgi:hypothetical protein
MPFTGEAQVTRMRGLRVHPMTALPGEVGQEALAQGTRV